MENWRAKRRAVPFPYRGCHLPTGAPSRGATRLRRATFCQRRAQCGAVSDRFHRNCWREMVEDTPSLLRHPHVDMLSGVVDCHAHLVLISELGTIGWPVERLPLDILLWPMSALLKTLFRRTMTRSVAARLSCVSKREQPTRCDCCWTVRSPRLLVVHAPPMKNPTRVVTDRVAHHRPKSVVWKSPTLLQPPSPDVSATRVD
mmetsp:Transcript_7099/g.11784  ORF Transcript_7099/g.11784 Transcript_7099/m.11784 type:complete len:202 (+) Transcript_7099:756-1361(+)